MGQPVLSSNIFFGNAALPDGQGTMAWLSLNDGTKWRLRDYEVQGDNRLATFARKPYAARGVRIADDFGAKKVVVPVRYLEAAGGDFGAAKALLTQAGEQWLSTDNKATAALAVCSIGNPKILRSAISTLFETDLEFLLGTNPFFEDVASTTPAGFPITNGGAAAPGTTVVTSIAYAGSVKTRPVYTFTQPSSSANKTTFVILKNAVTGETLVVSFGGGLTAGVAWTITIDAESGTVVDQNGTFYDHIGSFPSLVGPAGTAQNLITTVITDVTGNTCTIGCTYKNRWEL